MRNWGQIDLADIRDEDIQDRDKAIIELWDALSEEDRENPVLDKYRRFVNENRSPYGLQEGEPMTDYKHIRDFKNLADKVNETLDKGENGDLLAIVQELLDYNENNREAIIAECRDIDSKENQ